MSGFYVLGVPKQKLDEIVTRRIAAMERRLKCPQPGSTERRRQKILAAIHAKPPREVVSTEYSVPQFCHHFIDLAAKHDLLYLAVARKDGRRWELISED
jgi:hypothetical protein